MRSTLFLSAVAIFFFWMMPAAAQTVSVALFENGSFHPSSVLKTGENHLSGGISVKMEKFQKNGLAEYCISVVNTNKNMPVRLRFRMAQECAAGPGIYWDGFEEYQIGADKTAVIPDKNRYNFPLHAFHSGKQIIASGLAPWTVCSRFERSLQKHSDRSRLYFDIFLALAPQEKEKIGFVSMQIADGDAYTEAVEKVYVNYPAYFRPVDGADPRRYGVGGYFYSSDDSREYQSEEARRVNFSWEWYYNCYQKAGDIFPDNQFWDSAKGYKTERSHAACDTPGSVADWIEYNRKRIADGNVTAALHFYYLQQYCNSDLLKKFYQDSPWIGKDSKPMGAVHGWAEEGWANYAWSGAASTYGNALRKDLAQVWENFDIAGFALDMTLGDTPYYGKLVMQEKGKAFDADGRIFVAEGVAIAHNLDYTRNLPPKKDGRRAASITNEPFTYLPAFHGDGSMHEMPPYDRPELVAPRRMLVGQKPFSWWKGFRAESIFEWKKLSASEREEALTGLVDYVLMASFRFGAMPPVFFQKGFHDLVASQPLLEKLTRQGWRAASFAVIDGLEAEAATPFAIGNRVWLSRFGDGEKSFFALSAPDRAVFRGKLRIKGGKFGAAGAVYANVDGSPTANQVTAEETVVDIELSGHPSRSYKQIAYRSQTR